MKSFPSGDCNFDESVNEEVVRDEQRGVVNEGLDIEMENLVNITKKSSFIHHNFEQTRTSTRSFAKEEK
jgi:hypothetical protein